MSSITISCVLVAGVLVSADVYACPEGCENSFYFDGEKVCLDESKTFGSHNGVDLAADPVCGGSSYLCSPGGQSNYEKLKSNSGWDLNRQINPTLPALKNLSK